MPSDRELPPKMAECERAPWGLQGAGSGSMFGKVPSWSPHLGKPRGAHEGCCLELLRGVHGTGSSVPGVPSKSTGAGVLQAEAGAALWHIFPLQTPPHRHPRMPSSKKHRSKHNLAASARRARLWGGPCPDSAPGGNPEHWRGDRALELLCRAFVWFGFSAAYLTPTTGKGWGERSSLLKAEQPQVFKSACSKSSEKLR